MAKLILLNKSITQNLKIVMLISNKVLSVKKIEFGFPLISGYKSPVNLEDQGNMRIVPMNINP